jgi:hypothetical protein
LACSSSELISETYESVGQLVGLFGRMIGPMQGLYLHRTTQHRKTRTYIHASSGIRSHDPSVRAAEDSTCLRARGHWDRLKMYFRTIILICVQLGSSATNLQNSTMLLLVEVVFWDTTSLHDMNLHRCESLVSRFSYVFLSTSVTITNCQYRSKTSLKYYLFFK